VHVPKAATAIALGVAAGAWAVQSGIAAALAAWGAGAFVSPMVALPVFGAAGALTPRPRWTLHAAWGMGLLLGIPALLGNPWLGSRAGTMLGTTLVAVVAVAIGESLRTYRRLRVPAGSAAAQAAPAPAGRDGKGRPPHP
jgi:hypothetical protein